jgi:hypothetical protein
MAKTKKTKIVTSIVGGFLIGLIGTFFVNNPLKMSYNHFDSVVKRDIIFSPSPDEESGNLLRLITLASVGGVSGLLIFGIWSLFESSDDSN